MHKKEIPEIVDLHACQMSFKNGKSQDFFYPRHRSRQPEPPPTERSWGFLNMETIFHISFHQHGGTCLGFVFLNMQIGRNV